jgi:hypothetical protein
MRLERRRPSISTWPALVLAVLLGTSPSLAGDSFDQIQHSTSGATADVWRIDRPNVKQKATEYRGIRFDPGADTVTVHAGGCVQTGGSGRTWKRYVEPKGPKADRLYHGLIWLPGYTDRLRPIRLFASDPLVLVDMPGLTPGDYFLRLGYEDDDYHDNGYWSHDDGTEDQCKGQGPAWIEIAIKHEPPPARVFVDGSQSYKLLSIASGKVLDVGGGGMVLHARQPGAGSQPWRFGGATGVVQRAWQSDAASQRWRFVALLGADLGYYEIRNVQSGQCLDVAGSSQSDGDRVVLFGCQRTDSQKWRLLPAGRSRAILQVKHSGKVVDVAGGSTADGATIAQYALRGGPDQQWSIVLTGR